MENPQADELREFLEVYLDGILNDGLTQPLERWFGSHTGPLADAARSWHAGLVQGQTPGDSLINAKPPFPQAVTELLCAGIETGRYDYVVRDMIGALDDGYEGLEELRNEARQANPDVCLSGTCETREVERMLRRAEAEDAKEVQVRYLPDGYMEQRYIAAYVVSVRQPSRPFVVDGIRAALQKGGEVAPGIVASAGDRAGEYILERGGQRLKVRFDA